MEETWESLRLWHLVGSQQRVGGFRGQAYALDLGAVVQVFRAIGLTPDRVEWELPKMLQIFETLNNQHQPCKVPKKQGAACSPKPTM